MIKVYEKLTDHRGNKAIACAVCAPLTVCLVSMLIVENVFISMFETALYSHCVNDSLCQ